EHCWDRLLAAGLDRSSTVLGLGGGAVGDLAGFVAATYMRGLNFVTLPTTILAQVDASVGGKTAIDHPKAKNLIGAFHQPRLVIVDPAVVRTLPDREFRSGLAEIVKHGIVLERAYFDEVERDGSRLLGRDLPVLERIIGGSCRLKAAVIERDPEEKSDLRFALHYGHTVGHAPEGATGGGGGARLRGGGAPARPPQACRRRDGGAAGAPAGSPRPAGARRPGGRRGRAGRDHPRQEGAGRPCALRAGAPAGRIQGRPRRAPGRRARRPARARRRGPRIDGRRAGTCRRSPPARGAPVQRPRLPRLRAA